jgi:hypothetical protein
MASLDHRHHPGVLVAKGISDDLVRDFKSILLAGDQLSKAQIGFV